MPSAKDGYIYWEAQHTPPTVPSGYTNRTVRRWRNSTGKISDEEARRLATLLIDDISKAGLRAFLQRPSVIRVVGDQRGQQSIYFSVFFRDDLSEDAAARKVKSLRKAELVVDRAVASEVDACTAKVPAQKVTVASPTKQQEGGKGSENATTADVADRTDAKLSTDMQNDPLTRHPHHQRVESSVSHIGSALSDVRNSRSPGVGAFSDASATDASPPPATSEASFECPDIILWSEEADRLPFKKWCKPGEPWTSTYVPKPYQLTEPGFDLQVIVDMVADSVRRNAQAPTVAESAKRERSSSPEPTYPIGRRFAEASRHGRPGTTARVAAASRDLTNAAAKKQRVAQQDPSRQAPAANKVAPSATMKRSPAAQSTRRTEVLSKVLAHQETSYAKSRKPATAADLTKPRAKKQLIPPLVPSAQAPTVNKGASLGKRKRGDSPEVALVTNYVSGIAAQQASSSEKVQLATVPVNSVKPPATKQRVEHVSSVQVPVNKNKRKRTTSDDLARPIDLLSEIAGQQASPSTKTEQIPPGSANPPAKKQKVARWTSTKTRY